MPLMASSTPTGSEARQPATFRARYRVRRGRRGRLPTRFLLRERTGRREERKGKERRREGRDRERRTLFGRSDPPTEARESGTENAAPERFNMSARSIGAIDRPTESPYFRRTSSPTRAPIVLNYRSPLRSTGLVQSRLPPTTVVRVLHAQVETSVSLFHSSPRFARERIQFSSRTFGVNFINLSGHRNYTPGDNYFWCNTPLTSRAGVERKDFSNVRILFLRRTNNRNILQIFAISYFVK